MSAIDPTDFIITRKRKKFKFARFAAFPNCFEADGWTAPRPRVPLIVELGAGTGYFAVELARRHPDAMIVAMDVKADRLQSGAKRALELGVSNIQFVRIRADQLLTHGVADQRVSQLWLTFSDPYPKKRHAKHRLTHPRFLQLYSPLLAAGGTLYIKTDNRPLFDWSLERLVDADWRLSALSFDLHNDDRYSASDDARVLTTYEERFMADGLAIGYCAASPPAS